jgi:transcriptional regulator with XRE-family HTH domain
MALGERIARLRKLRDWTQADLAGRIGIHPAHVSRIENNRMRPKAPTLARLAEALDISLNDLLDQDEEPPDLPDAELLRTFRQAQELGLEDRRMVIRMVQALLTRHRLQRVVDL